MLVDLAMLGFLAVAALFLVGLLWITAWLAR
jgi:hypothetical protein